MDFVAGVGTVAADERAQLLVAWERWDAHCSKVHADPMNHNKEPLGCPTTIAMEVACQAYAESVGMACAPMRAQMATARRAGRSREDALSQVRP